MLMAVLGKRMRFLILLVLGICLQVPGAWGADGVLRMATTTSTENSGLLDVLLPAFERETGIRVAVFAKGTGAALRDGREGNVDVVLVHAREREKHFVEQGDGAYRLEVMYNDFVLLGPPEDPAGIRGCREATAALASIALHQVRFVSRGDESGTHIKELALWEASGVPLRQEMKEVREKGRKRRIAFRHPGGLGSWYFSIGQGMGKTLTYANERRAYTLSDRGTYLRYKFGRGKSLDLEILCQGDPRLHNPYGVIPISPRKHPHVRFHLAQRLARWLVSPHAQALIAGYRIQGQQAFFPAALPVQGE